MATPTPHHARHEGTRRRVACVEAAQPARLCSGCLNGALGAFGVYCTCFNEYVANEKEVAEECPEFRPT